MSANYKVSVKFFLFKDRYRKCPLDMAGCCLLIMKTSVFVLFFSQDVKVT